MSAPKSFSRSRLLVSGGMSGRCSLQNSTSVVGEIGGEGVREGEGEGEGGGGGEDETQECGGGGCAIVRA